MRAADIGSGTGRIARMLLDAGAAHVIALEPSRGVESLRRNLADYADKVEVIHGPGESLPADRELDLVVSIGVIQFIPDPEPTLRAALAALRPGGKLVIWLYAREGLRSYVALNTAMRAIATRVPHRVLLVASGVLNAVLDLYIQLCRVLPLPMRDYIRSHLGRLDRDKRKLTIYDQLNRTYVRFYERAEVREMLERAGFTDVALHHRRGYSWTALGVKPVA